MQQVYQWISENPESTLFVYIITVIVLLVVIGIVEIVYERNKRR